MIIELHGNRVVAFNSYSHRILLKSLGWRWDPAAKTWWTDNPDRVKNNELLSMCPQSVKKWVGEAEVRRSESVKDSLATDADISIPCPYGLSYLPYQKAGIAYALGRSATLIGDEMGLGKTIQAIGLINADQSIQTVLIVCPASLKLNWKRELEKWLTRKMLTEVIDSKTGWMKAQIAIINYDILHKYRDEICVSAWDLLVCDESHYLKNPKTNRTKLVLGYKTPKREGYVSPIPCKRKVFLTGTAICNKPIELWPTVRAMDPHGLGLNWKKYVERYCGGHVICIGKDEFGGDKMAWDTNGASNLGELQTKLREKFMIRRQKSDVLIDLPPKRRQIIELPVNDFNRPFVKAELAEYEKRESLIEDLKAQVEALKDGDPEEYNRAATQLKEARQVMFNEMAKVRHDTAVAKVPSLIEYLVDLLDNDDDKKIVFFAHHHDVIDKVRDKFKDISTVLTGQTKKEDRQAAVDSFQSDPKCKLFIGSITAAGVGITLTASSHVVFGELDWVPGNITQAEDRCHRIGQKDSVLVQHIVLDGSLDAKMAKRLIEKQHVIEATLNGGGQ